MKEKCYLKVGYMILISVETLNGSMLADPAGWSRVELHREGSAPAACAAGFLPVFLAKKAFQKLQNIYFVVPF